MELGRRALRAEESAVAHRRLDAVSSPAPSVGWVPNRPDVLAAVAASARDRVPVGLQAAVTDPGRRGLAGLVLLVAVLVVVALAGLLAARPEERSVPSRSAALGRPVDGPAAAAAGGPAAAAGDPGAATGPASAAGGVPAATGATASGAGATAAGAPVLVHVAGAVREPGLVELAAGSRVADAVEAAGGVTVRGDPASVNLARPVVDGEQVVVVRHGSAPVALGAVPGPVVGGNPSLGAGAAPAGPVDLNTATLEQLDALPGIGPVLAARILDWRSANGRFSSVDELGEVSGIGEATLADLRPAVRV